MLFRSNSILFLIFSFGMLLNKNLIKLDLLIVVYLLSFSLNIEISISHILFKLLASKKFTFFGKNFSLESTLLKPISLSNLMLLTEN